jgi:hypothetical protein
MYRLDRTVPLTAILLLQLAAPQAGVQLSQEPAGEDSVEATERTEGNAQPARVIREQSGHRNRQELRIGGNGGRTVVDQVFQRQTGLGNRQTLNLGATDR